MHLAMFNFCQMEYISCYGGEIASLLLIQVSSASSLSVFPDAMVPPLATEGEEIRVSSSSPLANTSIPPSQQQTTVLDNRFVLLLLTV